MYIFLNLPVKMKISILCVFLKCFILYIYIMILLLYYYTIILLLYLPVTDKYNTHYLFNVCCICLSQ